eukprot:2220218-Prymnesium_polylepis.2
MAGRDTVLMAASVLNGWAGVGCMQVASAPVWNVSALDGRGPGQRCVRGASKHLVLWFSRQHKLPSSLMTAEMKKRHETTANTNVQAQCQRLSVCVGVRDVIVQLAVQLE